MSYKRKSLLGRIKRECHDNPLRSTGTVLSLLLSSTAIFVSIYANKQQEPTIPYAHIEANALPIIDVPGDLKIRVEWHNDHRKPIVLVDNDLRLFDASGNLMPVTCCNAINPASDRMKVEIMPGTAVISQLETGTVPSVAWACMIFKRPDEEKRYAVRKAWQVHPAARREDAYTMVIDESAVSASVRDKLICS